MRRGKIVPIVVIIAFLASSAVSFAESITCWFPPGWMTRQQEAYIITETLSEKSGLQIRPRVADKYTSILHAFEKEESVMAYAGSFVQVILTYRGMGVPLVQAINGEEFYSGIIIHPAGQDPVEIMKNYPEQIAYTKAASSGEGCAKAATYGRAALEMPFHMQAAFAVMTGKAKAAFVKNWWWKKNKHAFPNLMSWEVPGISEQKNPDNVLTVSRSMPDSISNRIKQAALSSPEAFGGGKVVPFDPGTLIFSLELMNRGSIDPLTYEFK